jgi:hypothetical protein
VHQQSKLTCVYVHGPRVLVVVGVIVQNTSIYCFFVLQTNVLKDHDSSRKWSETELSDAIDKHALMTWGISDVMKPSAIRVGPSLLCVL